MQWKQNTWPGHWNTEENQTVCIHVLFILGHEYRQLKFLLHFKSVLDFFFSCSNIFYLCIWSEFSGSVVSFLELSCEHSCEQGDSSCTRVTVMTAQGHENFMPGRYISLMLLGPWNKSSCDELTRLINESRAAIEEH